MKTVFILWHRYDVSDQEEESKLIGVYETQDAAERAKERAKEFPGFIDHPGGFVIDEYEIGRDHWTEGFVREGG